MAGGEVVVTRLFESALQGNASSRLQVRKLLMQLDARGLLKPPEAPVRRSRRSAVLPASDEARSVVSALLLIHARLLRRDMVALFEKTYPPAPDVETSLERLCRTKPIYRLQEIEALFARLH